MGIQCLVLHNVHIVLQALGAVLTRSGFELSMGLLLHCGSASTYTFY